MDAALISAIFAGLTGLVAAVAAALSNRQRRTAADVETLESEVAVLRAQVEAAMRHIHTLRVSLSSRGMDLPALPEELRPEHTTK